MIRTPAACCDSCAAHRLGDTTDDGSFSAFLASNPDQAAALATYQANNDTGDPALQPVYYNPVTKVYGPVNLPPQYITPGIGAGGTGATAPPPPATTSTALIAGAVLLFVVLSLTQQPARRR